MMEYGYSVIGKIGFPRSGRMEPVPGKADIFTNSRAISPAKASKVCCFESVKEVGWFQLTRLIGKAGSPLEFKSRMRVPGVLHLSKVSEKL